jgi:hypothetical protein
LKPSSQASVTYDATHFLIDREIMKIIEIIDVSFLTALTIVRSAIVQERKIKRSNSPPAVEATAAAQNAGATIKGIGKEREDGKRRRSSDRFGLRQ